MSTQEGSMVENHGDAWVSRTVDYEALAEDFERETSVNARRILEERYLHGDTIAQWLKRIVQHIAIGGNRCASEREIRVSEEDFARFNHDLEYKYATALAERKFMPNTPCLANAGREMGQLSACFVLPIEDDLCAGSASIFSTLRNAAAIQQTGGGVGFDWSALRPAGSLVASSGGSSSGPISFLRIYDSAFDGIRQGGMRRGACMAILRVDHPDIEAFIDCKRGEGAITNFNISVAITDAFMDAVIGDRPFDLVCPHSHRVVRTVQARDIMQRIAHGAWLNGEPGVVFIDTVARANPVPHIYRIVATNPCGEQALGPYENCALGHINLARCYNVEDGVLYLENTTRIAVQFLNDMLDRNTYVSTVPQLREAAQTSRRIGVGITGLADLFVRTGIVYGSTDSTLFSKMIIAVIRAFAIIESCNMARVYGPFPAIEGSIWDAQHVAETVAPLFEFINSIATRDLSEVTANKDIIAFSINYFRQLNDIRARTLDDLRKYGVRNACIMSIAPTGTTSMILGSYGYGCEPIYSHSYTRTLGDGSQMQFCSEFVCEVLDKYMRDHPCDGAIYGCPPMIIKDDIIRSAMNNTLGVIIEKARKSPSASRATDKFINFIQTLDATALNVTPEQHIAVQVALQCFVDNGISKTINCPNSTTVEDVRAIYMRAYLAKLKGVAIYRNGSRTKEVLVSTAASAGEASASSANSRSPSVESAASSDTDIKRKRPTVLHGFMHKVTSIFGTVHTTVGYSHNDPFEVFINVGKSGTEVYANSEAIGRLISLILRMKPDTSVDTRLDEIIDQLRGIGGSRSVRDVASKRNITSLPDAVSFALESIRDARIAQSTEGEGVCETPRSANDMGAPSVRRDICPVCHTANLMRVENCTKCEACGYSAC